jgi:hypothetical protein
MKLHRVFLIGLMTSVFAVVGCNDSESASSVCGACDLQDRTSACETRYDECRALDRAGEECAVLALEECSV